MADKTVIILAAFREKYPNIREEIIAWTFDNPGETELKDFLFEILSELAPK